MINIILNQLFFAEIYKLNRAERTERATAIAACESSMPVGRKDLIKTKVNKMYNAYFKFIILDLR